MLEAPSVDLGRIAQELRFKRSQVEHTVALLDAGNTVPFITRYRKEETENLDEEQIRALWRAVQQERQLAERRQTIFKNIETQGKLTDELRAAILSATTAKRLEDLYLPFKVKKQTLATIARDRGLGPAAEAIWNQDPAAVDLEALAASLVRPDGPLANSAEVLTNISYILAERIADDPDVREAARHVMVRARLVSTRVQASNSSTSGPGNPAAGHKVPLGRAAAPDSEAEFRNYFDYSEPVRQIPPHRVLALNRGEHLGVLKVRLEVPREQLTNAIFSRLPLVDHRHREFLERSALDALDRLLGRSLEREVRAELTEMAEEHAIFVFARNLRNLLLQPPVPGKTVLAIDPGFRTGCKYAVLDPFGNLKDQGVIYPHPNKKKKKTRRDDGPASSSETAPEPRERRSDAADLPTPTSSSDDAEPRQAPGAMESLSPAPSPSDSPEPVAPPSDALESTATPSNPVEPPAEGVEPSSPPPISGGSGEEAPNATREAVLPPETESKAPADSVAATTPEPSEPVAMESAGPSVPALPRMAPRPRPVTAGVVIPPPGLDFSFGRAPSEGPSLSKRDRARATIVDACRKFGVDVIVIGNGTACRETEEFVSEILGSDLPNVAYVIVNEAGASVYSASPIGREEFPEFDATLRGTISIGRRLQDPLSELVKIDPQNIGVGLYQHDLNPKLLRETLGEVVESCVNYVGVDLNTASVPLLQYVSGLNQLRARNIAEHRKKHGPFKNREQLKDVAGVGPAVFQQAAGFLKVVDGEQPFDRTWIHPESYGPATRLLELLGYGPAVLTNRADIEALRAKLATLDVETTARELGIGPLAVRDLIADLARPGRDPREDLPKPIFRTGVLRLEDLKEGMRLLGTVLNVVDFGVFVDIGLKDSGLVHISQLANRYIRSPHEVVAVGDIVTTWVLGVDAERRRVSLTMIEPGTPRQPPPRQRRGPRPSPEPPVSSEAGASAPPDKGPRPKPAPRPRPERRPPRPPRPAAAPRPAPAPTPPPPRPISTTVGRKESVRAAREAMRKGAPPRPPVQLSPEAIDGRQVLHTFGELKALFEARKNQEPEEKK